MPSIERRSSFSRSSDELKETSMNRRASRGSRGDRGSQDGLPELKDALDPDKLKKQQEQRARRRSTAMQRMSVGGDISAMMAEMSAQFVHGLGDNATPKQKMERVMIAAKERGLTVPQIFKYFIGENEEAEKENNDDLDVEITPPQFRAALQKLCPNVFDVNDRELGELIDEFDSDGNGTISVMEFRDFCYRIPNLAWKAERLRFEREAEKEGRSVSVIAKPTKAAAAASAASAASGVDSPAKAAALRKQADDSIVIREIYSGTKVFWHAKEKLELKILECTPPHKVELAAACTLQHACLVLLSYGENARKVHTPLFADRTKAVHLVKRAQDTLDIAADAAIAKLVSENRGKPVTKAQEEETRLQVMRQSMANTLLVRLKLQPGAGVPIMQPLASDAEDAHASELIYPCNPGLEPSLLKRHAFEAREEVAFGAGSALLDDLQRGIAESAGASKDAAKAQRLLSLSMDALTTLRASLDAQANLSAGKRKWMKAFKRHFMREEVKKVRARLETSPSYHALLAEQEEKRKAAASA